MMVIVLLRRAKRAKKIHNIEIEFDKKDKRALRRERALKLNVKELICIENFLFLAPLAFRRPSRKLRRGEAAASLPPRY